MGSNMNHLMHKYNISVDEILETSKKRMNNLCYKKWTEDVNEEYFSYAQIIRELTKVKEGNLKLVFTNDTINFSYDVYNYIITSLCIN